MEKLPAPVSDQPGDGERRQAPPRVRKPSPIHDQYLAPTPDLAGYSARLREAFGNLLCEGRNGKTATMQNEDAGLELIHAVGGLKSSAPLQTRIIARAFVC
jgi:hypothetical protein